MEKFYFTYGTEGMPYIGGWTEVIADSYSNACKLFRMFHPDKTEGLLNCSDIYSEDTFMSSCMNRPSGNFGQHCQEVIFACRVSTGGQTK